MPYFILDLGQVEDVLKLYAITYPESIVSKVGHYYRSSAAIHTCICCCRHVTRWSGIAITRDLLIPMSSLKNAN